jgi:hypothetical protein
MDMDVQGFGLLSEKELQRRNNIHETICALRQQIPALLTRPLDDASAQAAYTEQTRLLVAHTNTANTDTNIDTTDTTIDTDDFELVSSRTELMALLKTLVLATEASVRASNFLLLLDPTATATAPPVVECRILVDPDMLAIRVEWQAKLLSLYGSDDTTMSRTAADASRIIQGISMLFLDTTTGKIATHRLLQVQWEGKDQDSQAIGQALSTLRKTFLSLKESPLLQPFFSDSSPLSQVRDELLQQLLPTASTSTSTTSTSTTASTAAELAPIYVTQSLKDLHSDASRTDSVPIDEWIPLNQTSTSSTTLPVLPGSHLWTQYAAAHRTISQFLNEVVPLLSSADPDVSSATIKSVFTQKAQLVTLDGSVLLQDAGRVANFYQSLAAWRRRSSFVVASASWTFDKAVIVEWKGKPRIRVDYTTSVNLPGGAATATATTIRGSDIFVLAEPSVDLTNVRVEKVQQKELSIGGNKNIQDGVWFMRSVATAVESGRFRNTEEAQSVLLDLVQRSMNMNLNPTGKRPSSKTSTSTSVKEEKEVVAQPSLLTDAVAANVYRIMATLHRDLPNLLDDTATSTSDLLLPPCHEYMSDSVELHGYLGEVLLRGRTAYSTTVGLLMASLRAAMRTGRVQAENPDTKPSVQVELTEKGNVRLTLTLYLKILPLPAGGFAGFDPISSGVLPASLPLKIALISEYVIDPDTGRISQHELVESRINGQLTPGDIVSQWIQRRQDPLGGSSNNNRASGEESWMQTVLDTVNWVRSMNKI